MQEIMKVVGGSALFSAILWTTGGIVKLLRMGPSSEAYSLIIAGIAVPAVITIGTFVALKLDELYSQR